MTLDVKKRKRVQREGRIKWWKLNIYQYSEFSEELRQAVSGREKSPDVWESTAVVLQESANKGFAVSSGQRKGDKETWW